MGIKLQNVLSILSENYKVAKTPYPAWNWKDIQKKGLEHAITEIYNKLGGQKDPKLVPMSPYHLEMEGFILLLDEEKSFNRYRGITLQSDLYQQIKNFPLERYKGFCKSFEKECLKAASAGLHWTNRESEYDFGKPNDHGDLYNEGSPAWKYRAFQEFLLDITPLVLPVKVIHLGVWENILINKKMYRVNDIILSARADYRAALGKFLERKINEE